MIKKLNKVNKQDIAIVGSKAANLGDLYKKGFNVPDGLVVTTNAYENFLEKNRLKDRIAALFQGLDIKETRKLEAFSNEVKLMFDSAKLQGQVKEGINRLLIESKTNNHAVRSSAVNEDLAGASFAGQLDTYLNVPKNQIISKVKSVFASLFNSRAIYYREIKKFSHEDGIAVIVQEMVPAEFAGVLFTIDPIKRKTILIEVAPGLGENIVSGTTSPNNYSVSRDSFDIEDIDEIETFDHQMVRQIARIGLEIEKHFTQPQDIEFAVKDNEVFILQARPITIRRPGISANR